MTAYGEQYQRLEVQRGAEPLREWWAKVYAARKHYIVVGTTQQQVYEVDTRGLTPEQIKIAIRKETRKYRDTCAKERARVRRKGIA